MSIEDVRGVEAIHWEEARDVALVKFEGMWIEMSGFAMTAAGFSDVSYRNLMLGSIALHSGRV